MFEIFYLERLFNFQLRLLFINISSLDPIQFSENQEFEFSYDDDANTIALPMTVLEEYLFVNDRPQYVNYGLLGTLISKEIARSLEIDALSGTTDYSTPYLWKNESESYFELFKRSRCIVDQYINAGNEVHNDEIFSENYVNLVSLDFTYEAYLKWVQENNPEGTVINSPDFDYTPDKLFWIYYELQFCSQSDDKDIPLEYKALNPIRNSRYFGKVFECKDESTPSIEITTEKCIIF